MESYRHKITDSYCAVIFANKKTGKLGLVYNFNTEQFVREWWLTNEKNDEVLEVKPITNVVALKYFIYWNKIPAAYNTSDQRCKKFDFFKYVLGADLSDKYRDKANVHEQCE